MIPPVSMESIASAMAAFGKAAWAVVRPGALGRVEGGLLERYGNPAWGLAAALPYDPRPGRDGAGAASPESLSVGAFASRNMYAALARLLKAAASAVCAPYGQGRRSYRVAVNSRLPEKRLAAEAGLGFIGRSGLLVTDAYGPACVIGFALFAGGIPSPAEDGSGRGRAEDGSGERLEPGRLCGSCRACAAACPSGAIDAEPRHPPKLSLCVQYWASNPGDPPPEVLRAWGRRLYGCDDCVLACPRSAGAWAPGPDGAGPAERAAALFEAAELRPGRLLPAKPLIEASDGEIRAFFRGTALGLSWLPPSVLRRNALIASGFTPA